MKIKKLEGSRGQIYYTASVTYQLNTEQYERLLMIKEALDKKRGHEFQLENVFEMTMISGSKYDIDMKLNILSWKLGLISDEELWTAKGK